MKRLPLLHALVVVFSTLLLPATSGAQTNYPTKPVVFVVPTAPGGAWDILGRALTHGLGQTTGKQYIVENRAGAGTVIGARSVAGADPDGYTLLVAGTATLAFAPALSKSLPYSPEKDFQPISIVSTHSYTLLGRPGLPAKNLNELIALGKKGEGLTVATGGRGTGQHVAALLLAEQTGMKLTYVPYKGAGQVYPDLLGGRVDLFFDTTSMAANYAGPDRAQPYMVSSPVRSSLLPNVPTPAEAGLPDFQIEGWVGVFAPAGMPAAPVQYMRKAIEDVMTAPEFKKVIEQAGGRLATLSAQERDDFVRTEAQHWSAVLRKAGIEPE